MTAKIDDITIPVFDGSEYTVWKQRITILLKCKKCSKAIEDETSETDDANVKAMNYLYSALSNKQLQYVMHLKTAFQIIKKLDEMYNKPSTALQIVCRSKLESIKLKDFTDVEDFFNNFEKSANELTSAGASLSEIEKLNYMLKALPAELSHVGDFIDLVPETERTVDYLKS